MASVKHVLVVGGHGKVAQLLTPLLLQRSWNVTSLIRAEDQVPKIKELGKNLEGKLNVLVRSLEDIKETQQAKSVLDEVKPDFVVWTAGAGGKGGESRTYAIDRDAASAFIQAAATTPATTRFIMISYIGSRAKDAKLPSQWSADSIKSMNSFNESAPAYYTSKLHADELLRKVSRERGKDFAGVVLRPGGLTDEPAGPVDLGVIKSAHGSVSRASVAEVTAVLLRAQGLESCGLDLLDGHEGILAAVTRCVGGNVNADQV